LNFSFFSLNDLLEFIELFAELIPECFVLLLVEVWFAFNLILFLFSLILGDKSFPSKFSSGKSKMPLSIITLISISFI
jgi:hypothetical protein